MKKTKRNTKTTNEKNIKIKYAIRISDDISVTYIVCPLNNTIDREYYNFKTKEFKTVKNIGIGLNVVTGICDRYANQNKRVLISFTNMVYNYSRITPTYRSYNGMAAYNTTYAKIKYAF